MAGEAVRALDYLAADAPEQPPVDDATRLWSRNWKPISAIPAIGLRCRWRRRRPRSSNGCWAALQDIPAGTVLTYGELARQLDSAARAIGGACRNNPIPILIPCHRVVGQQGLGGYAGAVTGDPLGIKRWLLRHEGVVVKPG